MGFHGCWRLVVLEGVACSKDLVVIGVGGVFLVFPLRKCACVVNSAGLSFELFGWKLNSRRETTMMATRRTPLMVKHQPTP